jgi:protein SCO1/2
MQTTGSSLVRSQTRLKGSVLFWLVALAIVFSIGRTGAAETTAWKVGYVPNAPVITQDGLSLLFYDDVLKEKISIISFIYTSCRDICPVVTARLSQLEERLGDAVGRDYFFVSISIDPANDTPARLKEYGKAFGVGPSWLFLTGKPKDIDLIRHRLGERSQALTEHRNEVLLFNGRTGEWERNSAFSDISILASAVRAMDPGQRNEVRPIEQAKAGNFVDDSLNLPGQALFVKTCGGCHTVGRGNRVGPVLRDVTTRRSRDWLTSYIMEPEKVRAKQDPVALSLAAEYPAVRMPNLGLSELDSSDVIVYIEAMTYAVRAEKRAPQPHHHHHQG